MKDTHTPDPFAGFELVEATTTGRQKSNHIAITKAGDLKGGTILYPQNALGDPAPEAVDLLVNGTRVCVRPGTRIRAKAVSWKSTRMRIYVPVAVRDLFAPHFGSRYDYETISGAIFFNLALPVPK